LYWCSDEKWRAWWGLVLLLLLLLGVTTLKYKVQKPFFKCSDFTCLVPALPAYGFDFSIADDRGDHASDERPRSAGLVEDARSGMVTAAYPENGPPVESGRRQRAGTPRG